MTIESLVVDRQDITATRPIFPRLAESTSQSRVRVQHRPVSARQEKQIGLSVTRTSLELLTAIADPRFQLLRPIILDVDRGQGGEFVVSDPHLHNYGAGRTLQAAVADYQSMLVDLYEELAASEAALSRHLRERFEYLRSLLAAC